MKNSLKLTFCRSAVALIVACCGTTEPQDVEQAQKELVDF
jgi:outer membrane biogenesis lipoprotein LolB